MVHASGGSGGGSGGGEFTHTGHSEQRGRQRSTHLTGEKWRGTRWGMVEQHLW